MPRYSVASANAKYLSGYLALIPKKYLGTGTVTGPILFLRVLAYVYKSIHAPPCFILSI